MVLVSTVTRLVPLCFCAALIHRWTAVALPAIPNSVRLEAQVDISSGGPSSVEKTLDVEEFVNRLDQSLHIRVSDPYKTGLSRITDYYRLRDPGASSIGDPDGKLESDNYVAVYEHATKRCSAGETSNWLLNGLTKVLDVLLSSGKLNTKEIDKDRTAIGPLALLQIVYSNAPRFKFIRSFFDVRLLTQVNYFRAVIMPDDRDLVAVIIVFVPKLGSANGNTLSSLMSTLSNLETPNHPAMVAVVSLTRDTHVEAERLTLAELLYGDPSEYEKLLVNYYMVEPRRPNLLLASSSPRELNPFSMPTGVGCGLVSEHRALRVSDVRQMSGLFEARDFHKMQFFAYDAESNHLRLDTVGKYKMIYDLTKKHVVYVTNAATLPPEPDNEYAAVRALQRGSKPQAHCTRMQLKPLNRKTAQGNEIDEEIQSMIAEGLLGTTTFDDLLGVAQHVPLFYVGTVLLDGTCLCQVFEREIVWHQIPLLIRLNLRVRPRRSGARLHLVYYLSQVRNTPLQARVQPDDSNEADETGAERDEEGGISNDIEQMWLRRVQLKSVNELYPYEVINAELNFQEFVWTLESLAEPQRSSANLELHPARLFDTSECQSDGARLYGAQLELEVALTNTRQVLAENFAVGPAAASQLQELLHAKRQLLEEHLTAQLAVILQTPRSLIGSLEVQPTKAAAGEVFLDVKTQILSQPNFYYQTRLAGYIENARSIRFDGQEAVFVMAGLGITNHECALALAASLGPESNGAPFYMIACPNIGCGYALRLQGLPYTTVNAPEYDQGDAKGSRRAVPSREHYTCELHAITKCSETSHLFDDPFSASRLTQKLEGNTFNLAMGAVTDFARAPSPPLPLLRRSKPNGRLVGKVTQVRSIKYEERADAAGTPLRSSYCLVVSEATNAEPTTAPPIKTHVVELTADRHLTRDMCARACQMARRCTTYSWNGRENKCALSNLARNAIVKAYPASSQCAAYIKRALHADPHCQLYALNALHLYRVAPVVLFASPDRLDHKQKHYFQPDVSLEQCAEICRSAEFLAKTRCFKFRYFALQRLCVIEDPNEELYERHLLDLTTPDRALANERGREQTLVDTLGGAEQWTKMVEGQLFRRDYQLFFVKIANHKLDLSRAESAGFAETTESKTPVGALVKLTTFYDLSLGECQRECAVVERRCALVDHCNAPMGGVMTHSCHLYSFIGPTTNHSNQPLPQATGVNNGSSEVLHDPVGALSALARVTSLDCSHHYLTGDNLFVKRLLVSQPVAPARQAPASFDSAQTGVSSANGATNAGSTLVECHGGPTGAVSWPTGADEADEDELARADASHSDEYLRATTSFLDKFVLVHDSGHWGRDLLTSVAVLLGGGVGGWLIATKFHDSEQQRPVNVSTCAATASDGLGTADGAAMAGVGGDDDEPTSVSSLAMAGSSQSYDDAGEGSAARPTLASAVEAASELSDALRRLARRGQERWLRFESSWRATARSQRRQVGSTVEFNELDRI